MKIFNSGYFDHFIMVWSIPLYLIPTCAFSCDLIYAKQKLYDLCPILTLNYLIVAMASLKQWFETSGE